MLHFFWYLSRPFYLVGLPFIVIMFFAVMDSNPRYLSEVETKQLLLSVCLVYFALGAAIFWLMPSMFRVRLYSRTKAFFESGFKPDRQFVSVMLNRLICFDNDKQQILYIDDTDKQRHKLFKWNDLQRWSIIDRGKLMLLKIDTNERTLEVVCKNDNEAALFLRKFFQS